MARKNPIHIKESRRGTFTAAATKHHMSVQQFASYVKGHEDDFSTRMERKATFAQNARKFNH